MLVGGMFFFFFGGGMFIYILLGDFDLLFWGDVHVHVCWGIFIYLVRGVGFARFKVAGGAVFLVGCEWGAKGKARSGCLFEGWTVATRIPGSLETGT